MVNREAVVEEAAARAEAAEQQRAQLEIDAEKWVLRQAVQTQISTFGEENERLRAETVALRLQLEEQQAAARSTPPLPQSSTDHGEALEEERTLRSAAEERYGESCADIRALRDELAEAKSQQEENLSNWEVEKNKLQQELTSCLAELGEVLGSK